MGYAELQRIMWAEEANAVYQAFKSRGESKNWAEWALKYPRENAVLNQIAQMLEGIRK